MSINELKEKLISKGIPQKWFSINDYLKEDAYIFREIHDVYWEIFYMDEKGNQKEYKQFNSETEACDYLLYKLLKKKKDFEIWKYNCSTKSVNGNKKDFNCLSNNKKIFYVEPNGDIRI